MSDQAKANIKIAILASCNLDPLPQYLGPRLEKLDLLPEFYVSGFNQYQQDILDSHSAYFNFKPEITLLFIDGADLFKDLYDNPLDSSLQTKRQRIRQESERNAGLISKICSRLRAGTVLVNNIFASPANGLGLLECNSSYSLREPVREYNRNLEKLAEDNSRLFIVDYEGFVSRHGYDNLFDERMWYLGRMPLAGTALDKLAEFYAAYIGAARGLTKKCLVLDLDNTLWGGVIGEDGFDKIQLSQGGLGLAYHDFQREILNLYKRGVILAVSSKNNLDDALEVIEKHPDMVLRKERFAVMKIDWRDKATHLKEIAEILNLGLDSFVFVDDNPVERSLVRSQLPEVTVVDLPEDATLNKRTLLDCNLFGKLVLTEEDSQRGRLYREQALRETERRAAPSLESFYESLEMRAVIKRADSFSIPRIAQLTQKTNQFNLTTRRYTEAEIQSFSQSPQHQVYSIQLFDKFGDNGIVGAAILAHDDKNVKIDVFLLSCRVIGRTVESAFLWFLAERAKQAGASGLIGEYIPTKKNVLVKDFYSRHGFEPITSLWQLDLKQKSLPTPTWVKIN